MYLASNTLGLLQEYVTSQSGGGGLEDSTMLAPVLDLTSSFSATHLEVPHAERVRAGIRGIADVCSSA